MRLSFATLVAASLLASLGSSAIAAAPAKPPTKSKAAHVEPLPSAKADASLAGKALFAKELPKGVTPADRKQLDAAVTELRADHLEAGVGIYRAWASVPPKQLTRDEALTSALWVFREGVLSRNEELANAADRVRFLDERNAAVDDSIALVRGAIIGKKPVLVARLVVLTPYVKETRGDEKRERQISRDSLDAEIRLLEAKAEEVKNERNSARTAFAGLDPKNNQLMQALAALETSVYAVRGAGAGSSRGL